MRTKLQTRVPDKSPSCRRRPRVLLNARRPRNKSSPAGEDDNLASTRWRHHVPGIVKRSRRTMGVTVESPKRHLRGPHSRTSRTSRVGRQTQNLESTVAYCVVVLARRKKKWKNPTPEQVMWNLGFRMHVRLDTFEREEMGSNTISRAPRIPSGREGADERSQLQSFRAPVRQALFRVGHLVHQVNHHFRRKL